MVEGRDCCEAKGGPEPAPVNYTVSVTICVRRWGGVEHDTLTTVEAGAVGEDRQKAITAAINAAVRGFGGRALTNQEAAARYGVDRPEIARGS